MSSHTGDGFSMNYRYRGARASVVLHEEQLLSFVEVWRRAKSSGVKLPTTDDPDYVSYDALLEHVLRSARRYLIWICEQLTLPQPPIDSVPESFDAEVDLDSFVSLLLEEWRIPLQAVPEEQFFDKVYTSPWGVAYCIDAMLEHAVMHPTRHRFQLEGLLGERQEK